MGEAADDIIDSFIDGDWGWPDVIRRPRKPATRVTCRYCGESNLRWGNVKGGHWRVKNKDGTAHTCASNIERLYGG